MTKICMYFSLTIYILIKNMNIKISSVNNQWLFKQMTNIIFNDNFTIRFYLTFNILFDLSGSKPLKGSRIKFSTDLQDKIYFVCIMCPMLHQCVCKCFKKGVHCSTLYIVTVPYNIYKWGTLANDGKNWVEPLQ